jgi:hypothetical protein
MISTGQTKNSIVATKDTSQYPLHFSGEISCLALMCGRPADQGAIWVLMMGEDTGSLGLLPNDFQGSC